MMPWAVGQRGRQLEYNSFSPSCNRILSCSPIKLMVVAVHIGLQRFVAKNRLPIRDQPNSKEMSASRSMTCEAEP
jgi:hypothetical protein